MAKPYKKLKYPTQLQRDYIQFHIFEGMKSQEAARKAGYSESMSLQAARILKQPHIASYIEKRQERLRDKEDISAAQLIKILFENHELAIKKNNLGASNKAIELIGKLAGLFKDEIKVNTEYSIPEALSSLLEKAERSFNEEVAAGKIVPLKVNNG